MATFHVGDRVMATRDLGSGVRKGDTGVVVALSGWSSKFDVSFEGTKINVSEADVSKV
jgi:hypothetical protein